MELESNHVTKNFTSAAAILAAILVIVYLTKSIFELGREFDESNQYNNYMKFGSNLVIYDLG